MAGCLGGLDDSVWKHPPAGLEIGKPGLASCKAEVRFKDFGVGGDLADWIGQDGNQDQGVCHAGAGTDIAKMMAQEKPIAKDMMQQAMNSGMDEFFISGIRK